MPPENRHKAARVLPLCSANVCSERAEEMMKQLSFLMAIVTPIPAWCCVAIDQAGLMTAYQNYIWPEDQVYFGAFILNEDDTLNCQMIDPPAIFARLGENTLGQVPEFRGTLTYDGYRLAANTRPVRVTSEVAFTYRAFEGSCGAPNLEPIHAYLWDQSGKPFLSKSRTSPRALIEFDQRTATHDHLGCYSRHGQDFDALADYAQACLDDLCPTGHHPNFDLLELDPVPPVPQPRQVNWDRVTLWSDFDIYGGSTKTEIGIH